MTVKNLNDFLGVLISVKNESGDVAIKEAMDKSGLCDIDFRYFIEVAASEKYVLRMDNETCHLYPSALSAYTPRSKKALFWLLKLLVLSVKNVAVFLGGVLSGVLISYFSYLIIQFLN